MISNIPNYSLFTIPPLPSEQPLDADAEGRAILGSNDVLKQIFDTAESVSKLVFDYAFASVWMPVVHLPLYPPYVTSISLASETCPLTSETFTEIAKPNLTANPPAPVIIAQLVEDSPQQTSAICKLDDAHQWLERSFTNPVNSSARIKKVVYFCSFGQPVFKFCKESVDKIDLTISLWAKAYSLDESPVNLKLNRKAAINNYLQSNQPEFESHFLYCERIMLHEDPNDKELIEVLIKFIKGSTPAQISKRIQFIDKMGENSAYLQDALGEYYFNVGQDDRAMIHYRKALALDPNISNSWAGLGYLRFRQNLYNNAKCCLEKAIEIDPQYGFAHAYLGATCYFLRSFESAEFHLNRALDLNFKKPFTFQHLAFVHFEQENWLKALEGVFYLEESSYRDLILAQASLIKGQIDAALSIANQILTADKVEKAILQFAHGIIGRVYQLQQRINPAFDKFNCALAHVPSAPGAYRVHLYRAEFYFGAAMYQEVLSEIDTFFRAYDHTHHLQSKLEANLLLGKTLIRMESYAKAIEALQLVRNDEGLALTGEAFFYLNDIRKAKEYFIAALFNNELKDQILIRTKNLLTAVYLLYYQVTKASVLCEELIKETDDGIAQAHLGKIALDQNELTKAIAHLEKAVETIYEKDKFSQMTLQNALENLENAFQQKAKLVAEKRQKQSTSATAAAKK